jgi:hypothetical protein
MPKIKIRLELKTGRKRETLEVLEVVAVPRPGDKIETSQKRILEVIEVVHTPVIRDWDAVVVVKAGTRES